MFLGIIISLFIVMGINYLITFLLGSLGVEYWIIMVVTDLVIAFVFTYMSFKRNPLAGPVLKNPRFHRNFAIMFLLLLLFTFLSNFAF